MTVTFTTNRKSRLLIFPYVRGRFVKVRFTTPSLYGVVKSAEFTTNDKDLINAMKASPMFNVEYFVKEEIADEVTPTAEVVEEAKEVVYYALCDASKMIYQEDSVVDIKTAQNWLQREHSAVFKARKAETIKEEAARVYNTIFINWK